MQYYFMILKTFFQITWYCLIRILKLPLVNMATCWGRLLNCHTRLPTCSLGTCGPLMFALLCSLYSMVSMAHPTIYASTTFSWLTAVRWLHMPHRKSSPAKEPGPEEQTERKAQAVNQVRQCNHGKIHIWGLMVAKNSVKMKLLSSVKYTNVLFLLIS